jgi:hypothetical protein
MMEEPEVESVPWGDLFDEQRPTQDLRRIAYLVAGLLGAVVLGVVIARGWWGATPPTVIAPGSPVAAGEELSGSTVAPTTTLAPLYSEADLMADPPDPGERSATVRAEWFVTDYFTADYEPTGSADVRAALPGAAELPDLPHDGSGGISYVEWARTFDVEPAPDGAYLVSVAFRTLAAPPDGAFIRLPVRAVEVLVDVGDSGATVLDLPRPAALPIGPEPEAWPEPSDTPPVEVVDRAAARASIWGSEPRIVSAAAIASGWRVVLTVADDVGNRWPLALIVLE